MIVNLPIEMICSFALDGTPTPIRFRTKLDGEERSVVVIETVIQMDIEKINGQKTYKYKCKSIIDGFRREVILRYFTNECVWKLDRVQ